jgi:hypothetical protein
MPPMQSILAIRQPSALIKTTVRLTGLKRDEVMASIGRATHNILDRVGGMVKVTAQRSMRYRPKKMGQDGSPPGSPPFANADHSRALLRHRLFYAVDDRAGQVKIGPELLPNKLGYDVTRVLEEGGTVTVRNRHRTLRRVGQSGEIRLAGYHLVQGKSGAYRSFGFFGRSTKVVNVPGGAPRLVVFAKLRTADQAFRANELNAELYGKSILHRATFPARPYMWPALMQTRPKVLELLAGGMVRFGRVG